MANNVQVVKTIPEHGSCFVCGSQNPGNLGVRLQLLDDRTITTQTTFSLAQQGPPGFAHGGASAALLDEVMGCGVWVAGFQAAAVELNIYYHKPVPLNRCVTVNGRVKEKEGRAIHTQGEIRLPDGTIAVTAKGVYVKAPQLFKAMFDDILPS